MPPISVGISAGSQPPLRQSHAFVRAARALRLDSVWMVDHWVGWFSDEVWTPEFSWAAAGAGSPNAYFDWQVLGGHLASRVGNLQLGIGVTEAVRRHPVLLAQAALTLAHVTKRPPILGIGAGEAENITPYGLDFSTPVGRLEEALEIIQRCFDADGPIDFEGRHFDLEHARMDLRSPARQRPEVWVAAHRPRMLELAGRFGDGWYPAIPVPPAEYERQLGVIRSAAGAAGRDPDAITPGLSLFLCVAPTDEEARAALDSAVMRWFALLVPDDVWETKGIRHPLGRGFRGMVDFVPHRYDEATIREAMAQVDVDVAESLAVWGSPDTVVEKVRDLVDAGLRHVVLIPVSALVSKRLARFVPRAVWSISRALKKG